MAAAVRRVVEEPIVVPDCYMQKMLKTGTTIATPTTSTSNFVYSSVANRT